MSRGGGQASVLSFRVKGREEGEEQEEEEGEDRQLQVSLRSGASGDVEGEIRDRGIRWSTDGAEPVVLVVARRVSAHSHPSVLQSIELPSTEEVVDAVLVPLKRTGSRETGQ